MGITSITVHGKSLHDIIDIVHQIKQYGWVMGKDFDWTYHKPQLTSKGRDRYTVFNFYKEEYSTYFALRWL